MPVVTANVYATFRKHIGGKPSIEVSIETGQSIEQLLEQLSIPVEETRILFCNNRIVNRTHALQGGDTVGIFPAIGGG